MQIECIEERSLGDSPGPESLEAMPEYAAHMTDRFFQHETLLRAQLAPGLGAAVRARRKAPRERRSLAVIRRSVETAKQARELSALLATVLRAETILTLRDEYGLTPDRTRTMIRWFVGLAADAIKRGDLPR